MQQGHVRLKSLQTQLQEKKEELREAEERKQQIEDLRRESDEKVKKLNQTISSLSKEINGFAERELVISEHAFLRYFERVLNHNLDEIKSELLSDQMKDLVKKFGGNGKFPVNTNYGNFHLVFRNYVVVTIEN